LIVDPTAVANSPRRIEHNSLRRPRNATAVCDDLARVAQESHARLIVSLKSVQLGLGFILMRINGEKVDAARSIPLDKRRHPRSVKACERALRTQKDDDDHVRLGDVGEPMHLSVGVAQGEFAHD
jgi:hypothetical protein